MKNLRLLLLLPLLALLLYPLIAMSKPHGLSWAWPTTDCDDMPLAIGDFVAAEIAIDTSPMPMPSDTNPACGPETDPDAPPSATIYPVTPPDTAMDINLQPGVTYYARIRAASHVTGNWSDWSSEKEFTVPYGKPQRTILD